MTASPIHCGAMISERVKTLGVGRRWGNRSMTVEMLASFELVHRAAIRALALASIGHVQIDLRVTVPKFHICLGAGAVHAALRVQIFGQEFNNRLCHDGFLFLLGSERIA